MRLGQHHPSSMATLLLAALAACQPHFDAASAHAKASDTSCRPLSQLESEDLLAYEAALDLRKRRQLVAMHEPSAQNKVPLWRELGHKYNDYRAIVGRLEDGLEDDALAEMATRTVYPDQIWVLESPNPQSETARPLLAIATLTAGYEAYVKGYAELRNAFFPKQQKQEISHAQKAARLSLLIECIAAQLGDVLPPQNATRPWSEPRLRGDLLELPLRLVARIPQDIASHLAFETLQADGIHEITSTAPQPLRKLPPASYTIEADTEDGGYVHLQVGPTCQLVSGAVRRRAPSTQGAEIDYRHIASADLSDRATLAAPGSLGLIRQRRRFLRRQPHELPSIFGERWQLEQALAEQGFATPYPPLLVDQHGECAVVRRHLGTLRAQSFADLNAVRPQWEARVLAQLPSDQIAAAEFLFQLIEGIDTLLKAIPRAQRLPMDPQFQVYPDGYISLGDPGGLLDPEENPGSARGIAYRMTQTLKTLKTLATADLY